MTYPAFYDAVRTITLYDPLAELLGASTDGLLQYGYHDAVKLAGHSCPTVAGAFLMTVKALTSLYGENVPSRGSIRVAFREGQSDGVTGVIANVVSQITGATEDNGFKGLAGQFNRTDLLSFNAEIDGMIRFERVDCPLAVEVDYHPGIVQGDARVPVLLQGILVKRSSDTDRKLFAEIWQDRVRRILIDHCDDAELITLMKK